MLDILKNKSRLERGGKWGETTLSIYILCKHDKKLKPCKEKPRGVCAGDIVLISPKTAFDDPSHRDPSVIIDGEKVAICQQWFSNHGEPGPREICVVLAVHDGPAPGEKKYLLQTLEVPGRIGFFKEDEFFIYQYTGCGVWCK